MAGNVHIVPPERDDNSVDADESYYTGGDNVIFCGQLIDDAAPNNEETFVSPAVITYIGVYSSNMAIGTVATCDTYHDENESVINGDPDEDVTFTLRSAQADTTPVLSCTIPGTGTSRSCATPEATTTDIASAAKIAMKVTMAEDLSTLDMWCKAYIATKALTST
jgi:hypothetical protein